MVAKTSWKMTHGLEQKSYKLEPLVNIKVPRVSETVHLMVFMEVAPFISVCLYLLIELLQFLQLFSLVFLQLLHFFLMLHGQLQTH